MNPLTWAAKSVKERGLVRTAQVTYSVVADLAFDLRYGTDTRRCTNLDDLALDSENKVHGVRYQASKSAPLSRLLREFEIPKDGTFVDFGSGKGRVLLLAALCGFHRMIGVEFSAELCDIARRNLAAFRKHRRRAIDVEIAEIDATQFVIRRDQTVFYLYNPFNAVVLGHVLANLRDSLASHPREVWLIYNTPVHRNLVESTALFAPPIEYETRGNQFCVFRN